MPGYSELESVIKNKLINSNTQDILLVRAIWEVLQRYKLKLQRKPGETIFFLDNPFGSYGILT